MQDHDWLAERFDANRTDVGAVAYRVHVQRERAGPTWAGPFDEAFPAGASASVEASSGRPTGTSEVGELVGFCRLPGERAGAGGPGPRGTAQQPVTSRVSSCFGKDHLLSPVLAWCGRTSGKATNEVTTTSGERSEEEARETNGSKASAAEPIPGAADRLHDIASELLAEIAHVDLHHVGGRMGVVPPDLIEELGL
jgi:hypothetical protein